MSFRSDSTTDETNRLLDDILQYVRASAVTTIRGSARSAIDSARKAKVYAALTGDATLQEIAVSTGVPRATAWRYQADFLAAGLAAPPGKHYRYPRSLFSLEELGLAGLVSGPEGTGNAQKAEEATL